MRGERQREVTRGFPYPKEDAILKLSWDGEVK